MTSKSYFRIGTLLFLMLLPIRAYCGMTEDFNAMPHYLKGLEYGSKGEFKNVGEELKSCLEISPECMPCKVATGINRDVLEGKIKGNTAIHLFKGMDYQMNRDKGDAVAEFSEAISADPNYTGAYNFRAIENFRNKKYEKAWEDIQKIQELGGSVPPKLIEDVKKALGK